jgi:hypothetical protein
MKPSSTFVGVAGTGGALGARAWALERFTAAHEASSSNRKLVLTSDGCGCFYCLAVFPPAEITGWIPELAPNAGRLRRGVTALWPRCGSDTVLASAASLSSPLPDLFPLVPWPGTCHTAPLHLLGR